MNIDTIRRAEREAKAFLKRIEDVRATGEFPIIIGSKETGALRRQSMELTRALAEMRRPS